MKVKPMNIYHNISTPGKLIHNVPRYKLCYYKAASELSGFPIRYKITDLTVEIHILHPDNQDDFGQFWRAYSAALC